jgi:DNA-binding transcriptional regulator YiaG
MSPSEFKSIRHTSGLSVQGLARALRVQSGRTVRKWEAGDRDIPGPAQVVMRMLERGLVTPDDLVDI